MITGTMKSSSGREDGDVRYNDDELDIVYCTPPLGISVDSHSWWWGRGSCRLPSTAGMCDVRKS